MQTADETFLPSERLVPPSDRGQRAFWIALGVAFFFHAALFVQLARNVPHKTLGDRSGIDDAISVELVTAADLRSLESVASPPPGAQPAQAAAPPQPPEPVPPEPPPPEPPPEPAPKAAEPVPTPAPPEPKPPEPPVEEKSALPDFAAELPDLATMPQPTEPPKKVEPQEKTEAEPQDKPAVEPQDKVEPQPQEKPQEPAQPAEVLPKAPPAKKKPQQQARLQPTPDPRSAPPGRSTAATRPPGITRSGENDDFGRGVIRALRQSMPAPNGTFGRVTVRLVLNENGDLAQVQVLEPSGVAGMDQSVVFATRQTYFPLPPYKSTVVDRTFIITYVYR